MKLYSHFAPVGISNSYLLAGENSTQAVLIDPGRFDIPLLNLIENKGYTINHVLLSHSHTNHCDGVATLSRIYDALFWAAEPERIKGVPCKKLHPGIGNFAGLPIEIIPVPGHSDDSLVFRQGCFYFTGDSLSAGRTGTSADEEQRRILHSALEERIFSRDEGGIILPGHGPPSTIKLEKELYNKLSFSDRD